MGYDEHDIWMSSTPDKNVCHRCITDSALAEKIKDDSSSRVRCSYCNRHGGAPLQTLVDAVLEGLAYEWTDPVNELMYIGREGGYQGDVVDGDELVREEADSFTDSEDIGIDVAQSLAHLTFTKRDYGVLFRDQALTFAWRGFTEQVKHRTRYLFLSVDDEDDHPDHIPPGRMLRELGEEVRRVGCVSIYPQGSKLVRVRVDAPTAVHETAAALGSPPPNAARWPNRMSPAGIPMFYAALEQRTALAETLDPKTDASRVATVGTWVATRDLHFLDLTELRLVPSLFEAERRHLRGAIRFLQKFAAEVSKPISQDEEHLEYVPTQIVTEYFRHAYRTAQETALDGILYRSSRTGEPACVVFAGPNDCGAWDGMGTPPRDHLLVLLTRNTVRLDGSHALKMIENLP